MKRIIAVILLGLMLLSSASAFAIVGQYEIVVNGKATRAMAVMDDGTLMVPMKAVCKALGYKITYKSSDKAYHIENGTNACDIAMDSSVYTVYAVNGMAGTTSPTDLGAEPQYIGKTLYVPVELFRVLLGNYDEAVTVSGSYILIREVSIGCANPNA